MRFIQFILRPFFYLLYHQFAWMYDLVAAVVSLGHWNDWVRSILPYVQGPRVLELGHGPGHLQLALHERGFQAFGLDESRQMSRLAARRLRKKGIKTNLSRGLAQSLPFTQDIFQSVVLTFPSEYIYDPRTLTEIQRVLMPGGRLVILPIVWITGKRPLERLAAWLFRFTGEAPGRPGELNPELKKPVRARRVRGPQRDSAARIQPAFVSSCKETRTRKKRVGTLIFCPRESAAISVRY